jgi:outer membrane protein
MKLQRLFPRATLALAVAALFAPLAQAQSLLDLYQAARNHDATYQAARAEREAGLQRADQAKAAVLPTVTLNAGVNRTDQEADLSSGGRSDLDYQTRSTSLNLSQPLFRPANFATFRQGAQQAELAEAQWLAAEQDLILRVSQAYFDVLSAQDGLTFVQAQKTAVREQLAAAQRNFEVGAATITDTREAQARYDLVVAQEIAADNDLRIKKLALDQLVGLQEARPLPLAPAAALPAVTPQDINYWVDQARTQHPSVRQARVALRNAELENTKALSGHLPTVDLTASRSMNKYTNGGAAGNTDSANVTTIGVQLTLPLFAGFATQNRLRETLALEDQAQAQLQGAERAVSQGARTAYLGVLSGLSQVKALEAAETSSQSALDANQLGYRVGVRINIDVLNAQSQLYQTKRDLAQARYNVLLSNLRLRQASGDLDGDDLQEINALLATTPAAPAATPAAKPAQSR